MTESESIKILQRDLQIQVKNKALTDGIEAVKFAIQALEKQIPKKPIMKQYFENLEEEYLCCPTCGEILTDRIPSDNKTFYFHCMNCGQKFDWSDDNDG